MFDRQQLAPEKGCEAAPRTELSRILLQLRPPSGGPFVSKLRWASSTYWRKEEARPVTDNRTDIELAEAILAAIAEAREHGIPEERIVELLAEIVKGLREGLAGG